MCIIEKISTILGHLVESFLMSILTLGGESQLCAEVPSTNGVVRLPPGLPQPEDGEVCQPADQGGDREALDSFRGVQ